MGKPILLILLIIGIMLGYYLIIEPRKANKTKYQECYEKCITPVIGNSTEECERFCGKESEFFNQ